LNRQDWETESKFYIRWPDRLVVRLDKLGASLAQPRTLEVNFRFDTANADLRSACQVLRLRKDAAVRLTFKGAGAVADGIVSRQEIEVGIDDLDAARRLLEALGFQVVFIYEKYRRTYALDGARVMVDELPYGCFAEIEGEQDTIASLAAKLGLDRQCAITESYHALFERVVSRLHLDKRDLIFANFSGSPISSADLGVRAAD